MQNNTHSPIASNFAFLGTWSATKELQTRAIKAESHIKTDPRVSAFYARNSLELMVNTVFDIDDWLQRPRHDISLMSLIHQHDFKQGLPYELFSKLKLIIRIGNEAAHGKLAPPQRDALQSVKELHHVLYWFMRTYAPDLDRTTFQVGAFNLRLLQQQVSISLAEVTSTQQKIQALQKQLTQKDQQQRQNDATAQAENAHLKATNKALLARIAQGKKAAQAQPDTHQYNESEARTYLIDVLLHEAGWSLTAKQDREYPVSGMPLSKANPKGNGFVDYVLWGDDGKPLALIEAKKTSLSADSGKHQAKLYADCLEQQFGQRPIIFYSNGYETRLWDDNHYPPRSVEGFYSKNELALLLKRQTKQQSFFDSAAQGSGFMATVDDAISNRHYQKAAISHVLTLFEKERGRKALLVMTTGTGKTRTVISLVDLMTQHGWVKNVLFLADRNTLLTQAKKNFVRLLPRVSCSILDASIKKGHVSDRLYFSTYPTMKNILARHANERPFGVGHFDLVVIDEAHRSIYRQYRQIFAYFDSFLIGLTATPKDDIEKNTYSIFDLQDGMPTYAYEDHSAYAEKFLVPPTKISVSTHFLREGIKYNELSRDDQQQWEEKEPLSEREEVLPSELNTFLFNEDTANKMFAQLLSHDKHGGIHVEGGDVIGRTIIFAANNDHAEFLQRIFDKNFPKYKGKLAQVITYKNRYAQALIEEFSVEKKPFDANNPNCRIAISVDMLDTGVDVPEVVNLVFFKVIRSKVKFTQMIGRGTRLCPDLFAPNDDKQGFKVFDYCQNFEYFNQNPQGAPDHHAKPLGTQIFEKRVALSRLIEHTLSNTNKTANTLPKYEQQDLRKVQRYQLDLLHHHVSGMKVDNFIVRPKRRYVEPFVKRAYWELLDDSKQTVLETHISLLPSEANAFSTQEPINELANRFDHFVLTMQLSLLAQNSIADGAKHRLMHIGQQLEGKRNVPDVATQLELIQDLQTELFWQAIDVPALETVRRSLRNLVRVLDKVEKEVVYSNFSDAGLEVKEQAASYGTTAIDLEQYRKKTTLYIEDNQDQLTIQKLKRNKPITQADMDTLERLLLEASGVTDRSLYHEKVLDNKPLGTFIRELLGLDRQAAKAIFSDFLDEGHYTVEQIQFVNQIIDYLTTNGALDVKHIFESPFTDLHSESAYGFFAEHKVTELFSRIRDIKANSEVKQESLVMA
jgi:type I restriction enzyme R subunit